MAKHERKEYVHTVTRLGTITIPIPIRRKYGIGRGSRMKFVETAEGIQLIPLVSVRSLFGMDRERSAEIHAMAKEILRERK